MGHIAYGPFGSFIDDWVKTTSTLSLSYDPIPVEKPRLRKPEVLYAYLNEDEIDDYDKLSQFLFLQKDEFYSVCIKAHKVFDKIRKFLKRWRFPFFISVVEYDSSDPEFVYGNHFILGSNYRDIRHKVYPFAPNTSFDVHTMCLVNYDTITDFYESRHHDDKVPYDTLSRYFWCDSILLGKKVCKPLVSISDTLFESQVKNLSTISDAYSLRKDISRRLVLLTRNLRDFEEKNVNILLSILRQYHDKLQAATTPLQVKHNMIIIAKLLINIVDSYYEYLQQVYNGGENIHINDNIRDLLFAATIEHQNYSIMYGVLYSQCNSGCDYSTPAIHCSHGRFAKLLPIFKPKGFTFLKFQKTDNYKEENWFIQKNANEDIEPVSFACFDVSRSNQNDNGFNLPFISACCHEPDAIYHWICIKCEKLVHVNSHEKIKCGCGIGNVPIVDPECLKCALKRGTYQSPFVTDKALCNVDLTTLRDTENVTTTLKQSIWTKCEQKVIVKKASHDFTEIWQPSLIDSDVPPLQINIMFKEETETVTATQKQTALIKCKNNVKFVVPKRTVQQPSILCPDVPRLTVLVIGRAESNNSIIIDCIYRGQGMEADRSPLNECIVNYREYEIRYVNIVLKNTPIDWTLYSEIHGFILVVENKVLPLSSIVEKNLRNMLGMIPRNGAKNCCIVNCLVPNSSFTMAEASDQLLAFVKTFANVHGLTDRIHHFCVDRSIALNHKQNTADSSYKELLNSIETNIEEFIIPVAESPITMNELKTTEHLAQLGKLLDQQPIQFEEGRRLMASIADKTMSDAALYYRKHLTNTAPLNNDEWKSAEEWDFDESLHQLIREINKYMKSDDASGLEKLTSTSIFAMMTDPVEIGLQPSNIQNVPDVTVATVVQSIPPNPTTKTPNYNVVMLGSSLSNKLLLLNILNDTVNDAVRTAFHDSDDFVIDYGSHTIRYINKDKLSMEQYDIHGIIVVIENSTIELSNTSDSQIREAFNRLPRHATRNCCIVNTFTPSENFSLKDAEQQMREIMQLFCNQHELTDSPSFICLDVVVMRGMLNHDVTIDVEKCQRRYESSKDSILNFLKKVRSVEPIEPKNLQIADRWKRLCEAFRPHIRERDPDTLRLMATIADNTLLGLAICCRKWKGDGQALRGDEWPAAIANVAAVLQELLLTMR